MRGGSAPRDLEAMFQLMHLRFTAPRADPTAFAAMKAQALSALANQSASPEVLFNQTLASALSGNHPRASRSRRRRWRMGSRQVARVLQGALRRRQQLHVRLRRQLHARDHQAADRNLCREPAGHARRVRPGATWASGRPRASSRRRCEGIAPKSEVSIVFSGPFEVGAVERARAADGDALPAGAAERCDSRTARCDLRDFRRVETSRYPRPEYRVTIDWTCDPAQVESLVQRVFQEVAAVRDTPLTDDQIVRARDYLQRDLDRASQDNAYLLNQLLRRYESGEPLNRDVVSEQAADIMALTGAAVTQAAVKILDPARYVRVTLMPDRVHMVGVGGDPSSPPDHHLFPRLVAPRHVLRGVGIVFVGRRVVEVRHDLDLGPLRQALRLRPARR